MSDLISRSELIDYFYYGINYKPIIDGISDRKIIDIIKNQPTAYDMDKVVEELEELADNSNDHMYESYFDGKEDGIREAIEIVKHGCVADANDVTTKNDDVCEWKFASDGEFIQNPHTKRLFSNEKSMQNVYCNTCGNKIKVVE